MEETLKITDFQTPCHGQQHHPLQQIAQSPILPDLKQLQGWDILNGYLWAIRSSASPPVKNSSSYLSLPVFSLKPFFLILKSLELVLVELHGFPTVTLDAKVSLGGAPSLQCADHATQFCGVGKLTESALNATLHAADKDVKHHQSQYQSLMTTAYHQAADYNSLSAIIQPVL